MARKRKQRPKRQHNPPSKEVRAEPPHWQNDPVVFSFSDFDYRFQWGPDQCQRHCVAFVCDKLRSFNAQRWADIRVGKHDHPLPIDAICDAARDRLLERKIEDIDELWRLRFTPTHRLWGIRRGNVFHVLWWDPDHQVYPMDIKNNRGGAAKAVCSIRA